MEGHAAGCPVLSPPSSPSLYICVCIYIYPLFVTHPLLCRYRRSYVDGARGRGRYVCSRMLTYAHVCSRMLTYADYAETGDLMWMAPSGADTLNDLSILISPHQPPNRMVSVCVCVCVFVCVCLCLCLCVCMCVFTQAHTCLWCVRKKCDAVEI